MGLWADDNGHEPCGTGAWRRRRRRRRRRKRRRRMMMVILCLSMDRQVNGKINEGNNKDKNKETQCLDLTCP